MISTKQQYREISGNLFRQKQPSSFFNKRKMSGLISQCPEICGLIGIVQPISSHPEGDVFRHTMMTIDIAARLKHNLKTEPEAEILMLSALLHDVGKPYSTRYSTEKKRISGNLHNKTGLRAATAFMKKAGLDRYIEPVVFLIDAHSYKQDKEIEKYLDYPMPTENSESLFTILALLKIADASGRRYPEYRSIPKDAEEYLKNQGTKINKF